MVVNDNVGCLTPRSALRSIASRLAPTGFVSLERVAWHADKTFHQHPRTAAHDGLFHDPLTVHLAGLGADAQGARRVTEAHRIAFYTARREVHQRPGNRCRRA